MEKHSLTVPAEGSSPSTIRDLSPLEQLFVEWIIEDVNKAVNHPKP